MSSEVKVGIKFSSNSKQEVFGRNDKHRCKREIQEWLRNKKKINHDCLLLKCFEKANQYKVYKLLQMLNLFGFISKVQVYKVKRF